MKPRLHPHAADRLEVRGVSEDEVIDAVETGETAPAFFGRTQFKKTFAFNAEWRSRHYATKTVEAYAVYEDGGWLVITTIVKYGGRLP